MEPPKIGVDRPPRLKAIQEYNCLIENLLGHNPTNPNPIVLSEGAHKYREQVDELVAAFETFPGSRPAKKREKCAPGLLDGVRNPRQVIEKPLHP